MSRVLLTTAGLRTWALWTGPVLLAVEVWAVRRWLRGSSR